MEPSANFGQKYNSSLSRKQHASANFGQECKVAAARRFPTKPLLQHAFCQHRPPFGLGQFRPTSHFCPSYYMEPSVNFGQKYNSSLSRKQHASANFGQECKVAAARRSPTKPLLQHAFCQHRPPFGLGQFRPTIHFCPSYYMEPSANFGQKYNSPLPRTQRASANFGQECKVAAVRRFPIKPLLQHAFC